jgi:prepilin-type N-terminal cleavage/methylation domain-containing protein
MFKMSLTNKKGFTLPELLIAAAIFAFAMSGILLMFINCAFLDQANRNKSIATIHAETAMEYIRSQTFSTIQNHLCTSEVPPVPVSWSLGPATLNLSGLTNESINATTTLICCSKSPLDWLDITVKVEWEAQKKTRSLELKTSISK